MTWLGATVDHTGIVGNCVSCHNGTKATGKSATHITTNTICEDCHKSTTVWTGAVVNHNDVTGTCAHCHDGIIAKGKSQGHPNTNADCGQCHRSTTSFAN